MKSIFEVRNLTYATPAGRLLQEELTFDVNHGQMLLITGSNGCGKSTLLRTLMGQFPKVSGSVRCNVDHNHVEYIPQLENTEIHFPLTLRDVLTISHGKKVTRETVEQFGLLKESQLDSAWNTASGGERKRTLLTRALLKNPWMLVFDEPMNHLDSESRGAMIGVMARFLRSSQANPRAIVMVCHQGLHDDERGLFDALHLDLDKKTREAGRLAKLEPVSRLTRDLWKEDVGEGGPSQPGKTSSSKETMQ